MDVVPLRRGREAFEKYMVEASMVTGVKTLIMGRCVAER